MSRVDVKTNIMLLKEAGAYFKELKSVGDTSLEKKVGSIELTQEHIMEWLEVFYEDRIRMDTCNQASVKM
jgi:hypothetical protein